MSKSTEINPYINYPVEKKSRQVINKEIQVAQLGRTKLKGAEPFSETTANSMLEKHLKKKKKVAPAYFLVDRIRFSKKGFHEYLNYREIQNFHRFQHHPEKFMLYVVEEKKGRRSYESYACNTAQDVQAVRDMITAAHNDPKRLLQDTGPHRLLSVSSSSSSEYYIDNRNSNISRPRSVPYTHTEPMTYSQPQYVYQTVEAEQPVMMYQRSYSRPPSTDAYRMSSTYIQPSYDNTRLSGAPNDVTYLRSDNINGPQIQDHGPVYMYVSRSKQDNRESWSPDIMRRSNQY